jgi:hypothetical protein
MDGRVLLGEALEQGPPVPNDAVEDDRRRGSICRKLSVDPCPAREILEPGPPERPRIAEDGVEVERECRARAQGQRSRFLDSPAMPADEKPTGGIARSVAANPVFVVTALGLILYGLLRLANSLFYDPLAVKPEEVGLGYSETLSQSAVGGFAVLMTSFAIFGLFLVLLIFGWALLRRGGFDSGGKLDDLLTAVVVGALITGAVVRFCVTSHVSDVVYAFFEGAFALWIFYRVWREVRSGRVKRLLPLAGGAVGLSVALTVATVMLQAWGQPGRSRREGEAP